jgi:acetyl-CoA synthetase
LSYSSHPLFTPLSFSHIPTRGDSPAIIFEADQPGNARTYTYRQVLAEVCKVANVFLKFGVKKGDSVAIYMPMIPDLAFVMLACARIGAVHSVIFAGFSADSVRDRVADAGAKWIVTADEGMRGGRAIPLKGTVDTAVAQTPCVEKVFVYAHTGADVTRASHDIAMGPELAAARPFCPAVTMDAEDPLFMLYTSGSTGKPKGVLHSTAGYLVYAAITSKYTFDLRENDVYACVADCGWITGHTYIVYGPLANGATTIMFESTPLYPDASRYWSLVETHKVSRERERENECATHIFECQRCNNVPLFFL